MVTGFFRLKDRTTRRPTFPIERRWPFFKRRVGEVAHVLREYGRLYFEMQELWLRTRLVKGVSRRSVEQPEDNRRRAAGWRAGGRPELWLPNQLVAAWSRVRGVGRALGFLVAMRSERY
jgi:hypothetical protein